MLLDKEHYDLISAFERNPLFTRSRRLDKEDKAMWAKGNIYQCGVTNELFLAFRNGYAYGKATHQ